MSKNFYILVKIITIFASTVLLSCSPAQYKEQQREKFCLESAEKYMDKKEAEAFCKQPPECRGWWDDLSEEEKRDMQPPIWKKDPNWMIRCDNSTPTKNLS